MQSFEVPQNLQCFLCNKYFIKSSHPFILYQCGKCSEKTSYCLFCSNITNKLLDNITFKCKFCNSLQRSKFKEEITKQNDIIMIIMIIIFRRLLKHHQKKIFI
jgi:hypothetical protein